MGHMVTSPKELLSIFLWPVDDSLPSLDALARRASIISFYGGALDSISAARDLPLLRRTHGRLVHLSLSPHPFLRSKLLAAYARCSRPYESGLLLSLFLSSRLRLPPLFSLNALLASLPPLPSLVLLRRMLRFGVRPNSLSLSAALRSAGAIPSLRLVRLLHALSVVSSLLHPPSLIAAYSKSGDLPSARKVFDEMPQQARSLEARTAMISALGAHGRAEEAVGMFDEMGVDADDKAVTAALAACAHAGMVREARRVFGRVSGRRRRRTVEHYTCMVDVLGRAGQVEEAEALLMEMEAEEMDEGIWGALLAACRLHGRIDVAERIADRIYGLKQS